MNSSNSPVTNTISRVSKSYMAFPMTSSLCMIGESHCLAMRSLLLLTTAPRVPTTTTKLLQNDYNKFKEEYPEVKVPTVKCKSVLRGGIGNPGKLRWLSY